MTPLNEFRQWLMFNLAYLRKPRWDTGISPPELAAFIAEHPAGRALDLGCGTGTNLATLAQAGWQVVGVDFAPQAVFAARRRLKSTGLTGHVLIGDATDLIGVDGQFDLVLDIGCYHALTGGGRERYRAQLMCLLRPGGSLLMYAHFNPQAPFVGIDEDDIQAFDRILERMVLTRSTEGASDSVWLEFRRAGEK